MQKTLIIDITGRKVKDAFKPARITINTNTEALSRKSPEEGKTIFEKRRLNPPDTTLFSYIFRGIE